MIKESTVQTRFEASEQRGFTSFTGREHELTVLCSCLDKAMSGNGQFVSVVGEAGMGKSRLVYEFRHGLDKNKIPVLQGRCQSYGTRIPYFAFINALRRGLNLSDDDSPGELHEKVISRAGDRSNAGAVSSNLPVFAIYLERSLSVTGPLERPGINK